MIVGLSRLLADLMEVLDKHSAVIAEALNLLPDSPLGDAAKAIGSDIDSAAIAEQNKMGGDNAINQR